MEGRTGLRILGLRSPSTGVLATSNVRKVEDEGCARRPTACRLQIGDTADWKSALRRMQRFRWRIYWQEQNFLGMVGVY